jgi:hypothetical protein
VLITTDPSATFPARRSRIAPLIRYNDSGTR